MESNEVPYEKQIFVCTNDMKGEKPSCCDHRGDQIFKELRATAKERGLHPRIRVAQATCLGKCGAGANIMVYPDNVWYSKVTTDDVKEIIDKYLPNNGS